MARTHFGIVEDSLGELVFTSYRIGMARTHLVWFRTHLESCFCTSYRIGKARTHLVWFRSQLKSSFVLLVDLVWLGLTWYGVGLTWRARLYFVSNWSG